MKQEEIKKLDEQQLDDEQLDEVAGGTPKVLNRKPGTGRQEITNVDLV